MTKIEWLREGEIFYIRAEGHAGYQPGHDIVCSAISVLMQTLYAGLDGICDAATQERHDSGRMEILCYAAEGKKREISAVFESILLGLTLLAEEYPEYVQVVPLAGGCSAFLNGLE